MSNNTYNSLLHSKAITSFAILATLLMLVYVSADAYQRYQAMLDLKSAVATAMLSVNTTEPDKPTISGTRQVAALSVFGKKDKQAKPVPQVIDAPITRLKLTLLGAISAENVENSKAIIQIDNKQVALVRVGDPLPGTNAVIHQIQTTQVVLMRNGKLERLAINRPELKMDERSNESDTLINTSRDRSSDASLLEPIDLTGAEEGGATPSRPSNRFPEIITE